MKLRRGVFGAVGLALLAGTAKADIADDILDLAARVDYGYYARDSAVIEGARDALRGFSGNEPLLDYYRAYAAWRLAELAGPEGRPTPAALDDCIGSAGAAARSPGMAAEAWVLVAACSALAADASPLVAVVHERRRAQALDRARAIEPDNPRLLLVTALHGRRDGTMGDPAVRDGLAAALAAFEAWPHPFELPDWGEAETLAGLGAHYLAAGDARAARDFIERALLAAPGFEYALSLQRLLRGR